MRPGVTTLSRQDGTSHVLIGPRESLPISEFRMRGDMALFGLPDEALLTFEGSGIDTFWTLEFPSIANPYGLDGVTDILLTVDARASHSPELQAVHLAALPKTVNRLIAVSAQKYQPAELAALRAPAATGDVTITFHLSAIGLPKSEKNRRITNLMIMIAGKGRIDLSAQFNAETLAAPKTIPIKNGIAMSNATPIGEPPDPPAPLNAFVGTVVDQRFSLILKASALSADIRAHLTDVILAIDYAADRTWL